MKTFEELGVCESIRKAIEELGFVHPMPVQEAVIPYLLANENDVIALAQTGTGKTAAFGIPLLERIDTSKRYTQALVLSPTRELCLQIADDLRDFSKYMDGVHVEAVYGGVNQGLMECVAKATKEAGGRTIGVVPMMVEKSGRTSDYVEVEIPCDNLTDRKQLMMDQSDVFIALPGGIGTLDEVFTVAASATIGYHQKLVILYNMNGFWNELIALLDSLQQKGMIRGSWRQYIKTADSLEEISRLI